MRSSLRCSAGGCSSPRCSRAMKSVVVGYDYGLGLRVTYTSCGKAFGHAGDSPGYRNVVDATGDGRRAASSTVNVDEAKLPLEEALRGRDAGALLALDRLCGAWRRRATPLASAAAATAAATTGRRRG